MKVIDSIKEFPVIKVFRFIGKIHTYTTKAMKFAKVFELIGKHAKELEQEVEEIMGKSSK